jgi:hypothetical protein
VADVSLTARQRNALPRSAFAYAPAGSPRSRWRYPVPTRDQARRAGIGERQRQATLRNAVARGAQRRTLGSYAKVAPSARRRAGAGSASSRPSGRYRVTGKGRPWRTTASPKRRAASSGRRRTTARRAPARTRRGGARRGRR